MKDAHLRVGSLVTALIILFATSFSAMAQDNGNGDLLSNLHQFRVSNYIALDAYYLFSANGDTETLNEIVAGINAANDAMNTVAASASGVLSEDQVEGLNQQFDTFKGLMRSNINDVRNTGFPDLRLVSDMANQAVTLNQAASELYETAKDSANTNTNPRVEAARSAAVTIAQMMAKYSARTNSQVAQNFQGASSDVSLDQQARKFDSLLAEVKKGDSSGELKSLIESLSSKWQFIRGSYINYNDNNVAFVIDRYSKGILSGLETAIGLMLENA